MMTYSIHPSTASSWMFKECINKCSAPKVVVNEPRAVFVVLYRYVLSLRILTNSPPSYLVLRTLIPIID